MTSLRTPLFQQDYYDRLEKSNKKLRFAVLVQLLMLLLVFATLVAVTGHHIETQHADLIRSLLG